MRGTTSTHGPDDVCAIDLPASMAARDRPKAVARHSETTQTHEAPSGMQEMGNTAPDPYNDAVAAFTELLCAEAPQRWFSLAARTPGVMTAYMARNKSLFALPMDRREALTDFHLMRCIVEMADREAGEANEELELGAGTQTEELVAKGAISTSEDRIAGDSASSVPQIDEVPRQDRAMEEDVAAHPKQVRLPGLGSGMRSWVNVERLQQAERVIAENHWLEHIRNEVAGEITNDDMDQETDSELAIIAFARSLAAETREGSMEVRERLWSGCTGIDGAASTFLSGVLHWAERSVGSVTIADISQPGAPLIYVNDQFVQLCGYTREEILGRNCRFLQGPETEPEMVASIQECMRTGGDCHVRITNYRKDGSTFLNLLSLRCIREKNGISRFVVALQAKVTTAEASNPTMSVPSSPDELDSASRRQLEWQQRVFRRMPSLLEIHIPRPTGKAAAGPSEGSGWESHLRNKALVEKARLEQAHEKRRRDMLTVKAAAVQVAHMERAGRGEVVVPGASWMVFGESFIGEHQRMLDTLQTSDAAKMDDESHGAEKHAHMVQLTLLSWLQPDAGVVALRALLGSRRAAKLFKTFLTRACPRLLPSLDELMKVLRNGAVAEINFSDPRHQGVPSQKTATRSSEATDGALRGQLTLHELLDKEMLLAWTEFLASDECAGHIVTRLRLPGTSVAAPPPGTFNALMQAMNGLLLLSETSTGSSTWLSMFTNATSSWYTPCLSWTCALLGSRWCTSTTPSNDSLATHPLRRSAKTAVFCRGRNRGRGCSRACACHTRASLVRSQDHKLSQEWYRFCQRALVASGMRLAWCVPLHDWSCKRCRRFEQCQ